MIRFKNILLLFVTLCSLFGVSLITLDMAERREIFTGKTVQPETITCSISAVERPLGSLEQSTENNRNFNQQVRVRSSNQYTDNIHKKVLPYTNSRERLLKRKISDSSQSGREILNIVRSCSHNYFIYTLREIII